MLAQLPYEIIDYIIEYLDFGDVRSIARVCSTFRLPAQLRLFRTIHTDARIHKGGDPCLMDWILSSPHLLQYPSHLIAHASGAMARISIQYLWPQLPIMYRLRTVHIYLEPSECSRALSALEGLGSAREIALNFHWRLAADMLISDNPLPVHSLELRVDGSNHQVATRLIQKCSQSLRKLTLFLKDNITPLPPFLPHLCDFSAQTYLPPTASKPDLMSWFPFLDQHPTITRLSLHYNYTLTVQPSPTMLPNLQFLSAAPAIIERLIPGRPVDDICGVYHPHGYRSPFDGTLQPLRQPFVPVTTVAIDAKETHLPNDLLVNIVQALPKLRKFTLKWTCDEVRRLLEGRRDLELTGNRFLSHYKVYFLLSEIARKLFISEYAPRRILFLTTASGLDGREKITFRWYKRYRRTAQLISGVLHSRAGCFISQKVVRRCE